MMSSIICFTFSHIEYSPVSRRIERIKTGQVLHPSLLKVSLKNRLVHDENLTFPANRHREGFGIHTVLGRSTGCGPVLCGLDDRVLRRFLLRQHTHDTLVHGAFCDNEMDRTSLLLTGAVKAFVELLIQLKAPVQAVPDRDAAPFLEVQPVTR